MCIAPAATEMEELQEADVLWPDHHQDHCHCDGAGRHQQLGGGKQQPHGAGDAAPRGGEARRRRGAGSSAPVGIRAGTTTGPPSWAWSYDSDESFVPPHVVLAARRRCSEPEGRSASSVCVGQGRTLKGRDLQSVRDAVLRMTGFLET
ncbi:hypothetical protein BAE44_0018607 [Dichanthelium oligosanthes]|uniref:Uncharacterized protein n=1 Tax=Dichanthelium oligosanthes TaxID=888268 RepID=A0A1E5V5N2_9POAL|nr:hypothetical protein BAE44_0018607 [Dichanthelium oligosanthes]